MKTGWLSIVLLLVGLSVFAQPSVQVSVDTNQILIGEQVRVNLEVIGKSGQSIVWPNFDGALVEGVEILSQSPVDTLPQENGQRFTKELLLTSFDSGFYAIPPFKFVVDGDTLLSEAFLLTVHSVQVDTSQALLGIKPPIEVEFSLLEWARSNIKMLLGGGIPLVLLIAFLVYWFNRPKPTIDVPKMAPLPPAHSVALEKLGLLQEQKLWQEGKYKEYHSSLTEIFREYLENRYRIPALEQTTDEIITGLRSIAIQPGLQEEIRQILSLADLVKFAKEMPLASENELAMSQIERFVRSTAQKSNPNSNANV